MPWQFEVVVPAIGTITEGPAWDGEALQFSNIPASRTLRYDPKTGKCTVFRENTEQANGLLFDSEGRLLACQHQGRKLVRYDRDGSLTVLADRYRGKRLNSPNDVAMDRKGRIWFSDPRYGTYRADMELKHESVYRLDPRRDGTYSIHRVVFDMTRPNGILVSPDMRTLYVSELNNDPRGMRQLRAYPIDEDGSLGPCRVLHDFGESRGIDGMCMDVEGNIIAPAGQYGSGPGPMVYVFSPNGKILERHPLPFEKPTNCTFGDADLRTLYVTTDAGHVLRARTDREGYLLYPPVGTAHLLKRQPTDVENL
jgi:gluconolactonase